MIYFTSDLHLGHTNCAKWRKMQLDEMHTTIVENWNRIVSKRDVVWIVGDAVWSAGGVPVFKALKGVKHLVLGNHDRVRMIAPHVNQIHAVRNWKNKFLMSHVPVHPRQLGELINVHGHLHNGHFVNDTCKRYFNVNTENHNYTPLTAEEIDELTCCH